MDLSFLCSEDKAEPLEIVHADTGEKIGVTFYVYPKDSNAVFEALSEIRDRALIASATGTDGSVDLMRETVATQYAAMVKTWESTSPQWNSNVGPFTPEKAKSLFMLANKSKSAASILKQVGDFAESLEAFTRPATKNS